MAPCALQLVERAYDCEQRALYRRQARNLDRRIDRQSILVKQRSCTLGFLSPVDAPARLCRQVARQQIFQHRQRRDQAEVLMYEADAVLTESTGRQRQWDRAPVESKARAQLGLV